jgi:hypothetical protein
MQIMKTIKKILATAIIISCHLLCEGQIVQPTPAQAIAEHKKQISTTSYIFEGTVTQQKYYNGRNQIVTTCIMQITKIFKGSPKLRLGSIKVVTDQAIKSGDIISIPSDEGDVVAVVKGGTYIIFGRTVGLTWTVDSTLTDNSITLTTMGMDYPIVIYGKDSISWEFTPQFKTKEDIYSFFKENGLAAQEEVEQK